MPAYRVREHNTVSNTSKTIKIRTKRQYNPKQKYEMKQNTNDARTSERLRKAYVLGKDRYLMRGRSNMKEREIQAKVCKS